MRYLASAVCLLALASFDTRLNPDTLKDFESYVSGIKPLTRFEQLSPERRETASVHATNHKNPVEIHDGLIHDWTGQIFIPGVTANRVIHILEDFDHHAQIYPDIVSSRLLKRDGNHIEGYWRLSRKTDMVRVVLDFYDDAEYQHVAPGIWTVESKADRIQQVENAGSPQEKLLPPGEGYGFIWRFYAYWTIETRSGGVLAECRTVSVSRGIPSALAWIVNPLVKEQPRDALAATLEATREAAISSGAPGR